MFGELSSLAYWNGTLDTYNTILITTRVVPGVKLRPSLIVPTDTTDEYPLHVLAPGKS
jgi:hypothetical protein